MYLNYYQNANKLITETPKVRPNASMGVKGLRKVPIAGFSFPYQSAARITFSFFILILKGTSFMTRKYGELKGPSLL